MRTQILDKNKCIISDKEIMPKVDNVRVTYARAKYFEHNGVLPKSEVLPANVVFHS